jgi:hypothetical protein
MENHKSVNQLIQDLEATYGEDLAIDHEQVAIALEKESQAYKGLGIKVLSIFGGIIASIFLIGFLYLLINGSNGAYIVCGLILIVSTVAFEENLKNSVFDGACISFYLTGCALLGFGVESISDSSTITGWVLLATGVATLIFSKGYMFNLFAVLLINGSLVAVLNIFHDDFTIHLITLIIAASYTFVNLYEPYFLAKSPRVNIRYAPVRAGMLVSIVLMLGFLAVNWSTLSDDKPIWISSAILIILNLLTVAAIVKFLGLQKAQLMIYLLAIVIYLSMIFAPAICGAILIITVSFYVGYRLGITLGILSLIYFVGQFYYDLNFTLIVKSIMMFLTGTFFLLAWLILKKQLKTYEQV